MRESRVETALVRGVKRHRGEVRKYVTPGRRHAPDRLVLWPAFDDGVMWLPSRAHFVELKAPGKKPRPGQVREHERLRKLGFRVFVLDTVEKVNAYVQQESPPCS
jgi:hypothetical protein